MLPRHVLREGLVTGLLGAATVALWFFVLDLVTERPFFTPAVLGAALFDVLGAGFGGRGFTTHVVAYTIVHVAAFVAIGIALAAVMHALDIRPSMLGTMIIVFVVLELGALALTAILSRSPLFGRYAWYQFGAANLLAAFVMIRYLWRAHHPPVSERWLRAHTAR